MTWPSKRHSHPATINTTSQTATSLIHFHCVRDCQLTLPSFVSHLCLLQCDHHHRHQLEAGAAGRGGCKHCANQSEVFVKTWQLRHQSAPPWLRHKRDILDVCMYLITTPFGNYSSDCHLGEKKTDSRLDEKSPGNKCHVLYQKETRLWIRFKNRLIPSCPFRDLGIFSSVFFFVPFRSLMIWSKGGQPDRMDRATLV